MTGGFQVKCRASAYDEENEMIVLVCFFEDFGENRIVYFFVVKGMVNTLKNSDKIEKKYDNNRWNQLIKREAERYGVNVIGSEVIGLIPMDAVIDCFDYYLRVEDFDNNQVLENKIRETK